MKKYNNLTIEFVNHQYEISMIACRMLLRTTIAISFCSHAYSLFITLFIILLRRSPSPSSSSFSQNMIIVWFALIESLCRYAESLFLSNYEFSINFYSILGSFLPFKVVKMAVDQRVSDPKSKSIIFSCQPISLPLFSLTRFFPNNE